MRWTPGGTSDDIEDRRDDGGGGGGGGFGGFRLGLGGMLVLGVLSLVFKTDLISPFLGLNRGGSPAVSRRAPDAARTKSEQKLVEFVSFVLDDNQKTWAQTLSAEGKTYHKARLVLFRDSVESACGMAESATGPFYCPGDSRVYIDLGFYDELRTRFGAPGEFAQAYVISHEIGHHIQNLLGIEAQVRSAQRRSPAARNALSVKMELQADCFAGIWGHSTNERGILEQGDVESGLGAAAAVGDDRLQKAATGHVSPESFTHGTSAQRMDWFQRGYNSGKLSACNTFARD